MTHESDTLAAPCDVIQIKHDSSIGWGGTLCIVEECMPDRVLCYFIQPYAHDRPGVVIDLVVPHGDYLRIGRAILIMHIPAERSDHEQPRS